MYRAEHSCDTHHEPNLAPETTETALVYTTAMLTQAERALTDTRKYQNVDNPDAAFAAIANASACHEIATQWLASAAETSQTDTASQTVLHEMHSKLAGQAQKMHTVIEFAMAEIMESLSQFGHASDTSSWYSNRRQPVHALAAFRYIQTLLNADHTNDSTWSQAYHTACIETMEQLAQQPIFEPMDEAEARRIQTRYHAFTNAKREAQQEYEDATRQLAQLCEQALQAYNDAIPLVVSPKMQGFPILTQTLTEMPLSTLGLLPGLYYNYAIIDMLAQHLEQLSDLPVETPPRNDSTPHDEGFIAYVAFIHQGVKYIQAVADPYPKGFPADLVVEHMEASLDHLETRYNSPGANNTALAWCGFDETISARLDSAIMGLHDITAADLIQIINVANRLRLPHGARIAMFEAATSWDSAVAALILRDTPHANPRLASRRQASKIVHAARQAGLDNYKLAELAEVLGHSPQRLGVKTPKLPPHTVATLRETAQQAGLPPAAIDAMLEALEPSDQPLQITKLV